MKLHDLRPAEGSHRPRTRVGRGIAGGKGKTAGRGTKGQKSRTGGTIQPWFEGGQTPIHVRLPKLRGFRNLLRVEYEVVNVGRISALAETGVLDPTQVEGTAAKTSSRPVPVTVTPDILAAAGIVRTLNRPLKILGQGEVSRALFVVADAFSKSATAKIQAAGGTAQVLEMPEPMSSLKSKITVAETRDGASGADAGPGVEPAAEGPRAEQKIPAAEPAPADKAAVDRSSAAVKSPAAGKAARAVKATLVKSPAAGKAAPAVKAPVIKPPVAAKAAPAVKTPVDAKAGPAKSAARKADKAVPPRKSPAAKAAPNQ